MGEGISCFRCIYIWNMICMDISIYTSSLSQHVGLGTGCMHPKHNIILPLIEQHRHKLKRFYLPPAPGLQIIALYFVFSEKGKTSKSHSHVFCIISWFWWVNMRIIKWLTCEHLIFFLVSSSIWFVANDFPPYF